MNENNSKFNLNKNQLFVMLLIVGVLLGMLMSFLGFKFIGGGLSPEDANALKTEILTDVDKKISGLNVTNLPEKNNDDDVLNTVYQNVKNKFGSNYLPNYKISKKELEKRFDIKSEMYIEYFGEKAVENANIDEFLGFKVDKGFEDKIVEKLTAYQNKRLENKNEYPSDLIKIKNAKIIKKEGFVYWVMLSNLSSVTINQGESAIEDKVTSDIKSAVECIDKTFEDSKKSEENNNKKDVENSNSDNNVDDFTKK